MNRDVVIERLESYRCFCEGKTVCEVCRRVWGLFNMFDREGIGQKNSEHDAPKNPAEKTPPTTTQNTDPVVLAKFDQLDKRNAQLAALLEKYADRVAALKVENDALKTCIPRLKPKHKKREGRKLTNTERAIKSNEARNRRIEMQLLGECLGVSLGNKFLSFAEIKRLQKLCVEKQRGAAK